MKIYENSYRGTKVTYRISDHVRGIFELEYAKEVFPVKDWFETEPFVNELKVEWKTSTEKFKERLGKVYKSQEDVSKLKTIGIMLTDKNIMMELYNIYKEGGQGLSFTDLLNKVDLANSTLNNCITRRLIPKGFVRHTDELYSLTKDGISLIENNIDMFT